MSQTFDMQKARALIASYHPNFSAPYEIRELESALDEIDHLQSLIERTSAAWLKLEPGVAWEGGIDAAMAAAVSEIERLQQIEQIEYPNALDVLAKEQREALEWTALLLEDCNHPDWVERQRRAVQIRAILASYIPAWKVTDVRKDALRFCLSGDFSPQCTCKHCQYNSKVLQAMLDEVRP
jgi:hypothetical protein